MPSNLESWQPPEPVEFEHDGSFMLQLDYPDYLASGETPEEARLNFWKGLALTLWERSKAGLPLDGHAAPVETAAHHKPGCLAAELKSGDASGVCECGAVKISG